MDNPFLALNPTTSFDGTSGPAAWELADQNRKQKRNALYARYTPLVYDILDQLMDAYQLGTWKRGSDCDHAYCCHCRWYAGPEETGRAHYDDHAVRRQLDIELETDDQCSPTGFKVLYHGASSRCVHTALSRDELVRGIQAVLYSF